MKTICHENDNNNQKRLSFYNKKKYFFIDNELNELSIINYKHIKEHI